MGKRQSYLFDGNDLVDVKAGNFFFEIEIQGMASKWERDRKWDGDGEVVGVVAGLENILADLQRWMDCQGEKKAKK